MLHVDDWDAFKQVPHDQVAGLHELLVRQAAYVGYDFDNLTEEARGVLCDEIVGQLQEDLWVAGSQRRLFELLGFDAQLFEYSQPQQVSTHELQTVLGVGHSSLFGN